MVLLSLTHTWWIKSECKLSLLFWKCDFYLIYKMLALKFFDMSLIVQREENAKL